MNSGNIYRLIIGAHHFCPIYQIYLFRKGDIA